MKSQRVKNPQEYAEVITALPRAIMQVEGIKAWVLQGETRQLVFFETDSNAQVPEHSHGYPQWGVMLTGKMQLTVDGRVRVIEKGGEYVIPANAKHCATFLSRSRWIDFFSEKTRYKTESANQR